LFRKSEGGETPASNVSRQDWEATDSTGTPPEKKNAVVDLGGREAPVKEAGKRRKTPEGKGSSGHGTGTCRLEIAA